MQRVVIASLVGLLTLDSGLASERPEDDAHTTGAAHEIDALHSLALDDRAAFARQVSESASTDRERADAVVTWFATHFDWTATDYQKRTVDEILQRRGGNCAELARVATAMLDELGLRMRRVREINVHVESARRGQTARRKVAESGYRMSVFGKRHNDHVWIEIQDGATGEWFPADPSLGVVGREKWLASRFGFGERFSLDPSSVDMIVPFAVFAEDDAGDLGIDRTALYVIDGFDALYSGALHALPAWAEWVRLVELLDPAALAAFEGDANLHDHEAEIDALAATYARLDEQYAAAHPARK